LNIDDFVHPLRSDAYGRTLVSIFDGLALSKVKLCAPRSLCTWSMDVRIIQSCLGGRELFYFLRGKPPEASPLDVRLCEIFRKLTARVIGPEVVKTRFATAHNTIIFNTHLLANDDAITRLVSDYRSRFAARILSHCTTL